ncbi:unnamed protein product, partial [Staurois parvus]
EGQFCDSFCLFLTVLGHSLHTAVSTAVWRECHRTVRNRLLMTVLGLSFHTMFQPLHGRTVPELSLIVYF